MGIKFSPCRPCCSPLCVCGTLLEKPLVPYNCFTGQVYPPLVNYNKTSPDAQTCFWKGDLPAATTPLLDQLRPDYAAAAAAGRVQTVRFTVSNGSGSGATYDYPVPCSPAVASPAEFGLVADPPLADFQGQEQPADHSAAPVLMVGRKLDPAAGCASDFVAAPQDRECPFNGGATHATGNTLGNAAETRYNCSYTTFNGAPNTLCGMDQAQVPRPAEYTFAPARVPSPLPGVQGLAAMDLYMGHPVLLTTEDLAAAPARPFVAGRALPRRLRVTGTALSCVVRRSPNNFPFGRALLVPPGINPSFSGFMYYDAFFHRYCSSVDIGNGLTFNGFLNAVPADDPGGTEPALWKGMSGQFLFGKPALPGTPPPPQYYVPLAPGDGSDGAAYFPDDSTNDPATQVVFSDPQAVVHSNAPFVRQFVAGGLYIWGYPLGGYPVPRPTYRPPGFPPNFIVYDWESTFQGTGSSVVGAARYLIRIEE